MQQYEYKCIPIFALGPGTTERLNLYGADGWELVTVFWVWHYFKRPRINRH